MDLNKVCTFIEVSDVEGFEEYDVEVGFGKCVYLGNGIVVSNDMVKGYKELVERYENRGGREYLCLDRTL